MKAWGCASYGHHAGAGGKGGAFHEPGDDGESGKTDHTFGRMTAITKPGTEGPGFSV